MGFSHGNFTIPLQSSHVEPSPCSHTGGLALGVRRLATQGATDATCDVAEGLEVLGDSMVIFSDLVT